MRNKLSKLFLISLNWFGSLRSMAPDLAAFLIELSNPQYLNEDIASQVDSARIPIDQNFSWGVGIGIQRRYAKFRIT